MPATPFVYGYIDQFGSVSFRTANIKPLRCRLRGGKSARVLTLVNGVAVNVDGTSGSLARYPIEQQLDILVTGSAPGGGTAVDDIIQTVVAKYGDMDNLRIRVPSGARLYTAQSILDSIEFAEDGTLHDSGLVNWSILTLFFQQLEDFS